MLTGGGGHGNNDESVLSGKQMEQQQQYKNPCEFEWKQFVEWLIFELYYIHKSFLYSRN